MLIPHPKEGHLRSITDQTELAPFLAPGLESTFQERLSIGRKRRKKAIETELEKEKCGPAMMGKFPGKQHRKRERAPRIQWIDRDASGML